MKNETVPIAAMDDETRRLFEAALAVQANAHVPYSRYPVGCALVSSVGTLHVGANIENAAYGVTLCAECSLVSAMVMGGGGRIVAFACVNGAGERLMPCGRCRQLLYEHGGGAMLIDRAGGPSPLRDLLPEAFGPEALP